MFAVVTKSLHTADTRKLTITDYGCACQIQAGRRTSRRKLRRVLKKFGTDVIFGAGADTCGITPFDTGAFKEHLLFRQFAHYVLSLEGFDLKIGLLDKSGNYLSSDTLTELIAHAADAVICTDFPAEEHCKRWILYTGICPEVTLDRSYLRECDCVFAPEGLKGCAGTVFGRGGKGLDRSIIDLPPQFRPLVDSGVDPAELLCMLEREKEVSAAVNAAETEIKY